MKIPENKSPSRLQYSYDIVMFQELGHHLSKPQRQHRLVQVVFQDLHIWQEIHTIQFYLYLLMPQYRNQNCIVYHGVFSYDDKNRETLERQ